MFLGCEGWGTAGRGSRKMLSEGGRQNEVVQKKFLVLVC